MTRSTSSLAFRGSEPAKGPEGSKKVRIVLTPEQEARFRAEWQDGALSISHVACWLEISDHTLRRIARDLGLGPKVVGEGVWTDEAITSLKAWWAEGLSARTIGERLGVSRNAVLGKIHRLGCATRALPSAPTRIRLGLAKAGGAPKQARAPKPPKVKRQRVVNSFAAVNAARRAASPQGPEIIEPVPVVFDATKAKPWLERRFGECAYPISGTGADTFSCCLPTGEHTYCKAHRRIMFVKPEPPKRLERMLRRFAA